MLQLAFYKGRKTIIDKAVAWWTESKYSHVELFFLDSGYSFTASFIEKGTVYRSRTFNTNNWDFYNVDHLFTIEQIHQLETMCKVRALKKEPYDWVGIVRFVLPFPFIRNSKAAFCSEVILEQFQRLGLYPEITPYRYTPGMLKGLIN